jgi:hypothetical protein
MTEQLRLPPRVKQLEDEQVLGRWRASRTQSSLRLVHGHLYLTTRRLVFAPHDWDAALSGVYIQCGLNGILGLCRQERDTSQILGGSLRERLCIEFDDFSVERFRVKDIDDVIAQIRAAANLS